MASPKSSADGFKADQPGSEGDADHRPDADGAVFAAGPPPPEARFDAAAGSAVAGLYDPVAEPASDYFSEESATLGDRIAAARQKMSLTQAGLAARLGVGAKIVSAWENDRSEPRANRLATLSGLLGVSVAWLLTGRGEGVSPPTQTEAATPAVFHLSIAATDLAEAQAFYGDLLGCAPRGSDETSARFAFFGGVLTVHLRDDPELWLPAGLDDARRRPTPSLAVVLDWDAWSALIERLRAGGAGFLVEPTIRHVGAPEEEGGFFLADPSGNALEFRALRDRERGAA